MCGIFGFSKTTPETKMMTATLAIAMQQRGQDSWGVTDGDELWHALGPICDTFEDFGLDGPTYHTRGASVGKVTMRNAHPFQAFSADGTKRVVGVHNGHISNWEALKTKYKRNALEVDSEHIFMHLAEDAPVAELGGWGAVVWYEMPTDHPEQRRRYLTKWGNADNLAIARLDVPKSPLVFASTKGAIVTAARFAGVKVSTFFEIKEKRRYEFAVDELGETQLVYDEVPMTWGESVFLEPRTSSVERVTYGGRGITNIDKNCAICAKDREKPRDQLVCDRCMEGLIVQYYGEDLWPALVIAGGA